MYIYNYFISLLGICVSCDTRLELFDTIHDTKKLKIDSRYDSRFDNYDSNHYFTTIYKQTRSVKYNPT